MALEINGEFVDDTVIRREAQILKPRFTEMLADYDAIAAEMHLREVAREQVIHRVLLRQEASKDPEPIRAEALEQLLAQMRQTTPGGSSCITPMNESAF